MLICDFDGTVISEDLEKEFLKFYTSNYLRALDIFVGGVFTPVNLLRKYFSRGSIVKVWTLFRTEEEQKSIFSDFLKVYKPSINFDVVKILDSYSGRVLLLSGCYELLLTEFLFLHGLDNKFNIVVGAKTRPSGFFISRHPYGRTKTDFFDSGDIGIGNEFADRFFLSKCRKVYLKDPDDKLIGIANKLGWEII